MVRSMLIHLKPADNRLWAEARSAAVYIRNRLRHSQLKQRASLGEYTPAQEKSPFEMLHNKQPSISHLQPFGSLCYIHIPEEKRSAGSKLQSRAGRSTFVGYTQSPNIYKVQPANKQIFTVHSKNCTFVNHPEPTPQPLSQTANQVLSQPLSQPLNQPLNEPDNIDIPHSSTLLAIALAVNECAPKTFKQATTCADAPRWYKAMQGELKLLASQDVWTVVPIPPRGSIVECKWVYKIKRDSAGQIANIRQDWWGRG